MTKKRSSVTNDRLSVIKERLFMTNDRLSGVNDRLFMAKERLSVSEKPSFEVENTGFVAK